MKTAFLAASAALFITASTSQAATIVNGGFEDSTFTGSFQEVPAGGTAVSGWAVGNGGVDLINTYWENAEGSYSLDLNRRSAGSVSQTIFDLVAGAAYRISFAMAGNPAGGSNPKSLTATVGTVASETFTFDASSTSLSDMGWVENSFDFIADGESALLTFASDQGTAFGPALDDVRIAELAVVPIPATALLLLAGLGGLAMARRRR